jgi:hypothetical protein
MTINGRSTAVSFDQAHQQFIQAKAALKQPPQRSRPAAPFFWLIDRWRLRRCRQQYRQAYFDSRTKWATAKPVIITVQQPAGQPQRTAAAIVTPLATRR